METRVQQSWKKTMKICVIVRNEVAISIQIDYTKHVLKTMEEKEKAWERGKVLKNWREWREGEALCTSTQLLSRLKQTKTQLHLRIDDSQNYYSWCVICAHRERQWVLIHVWSLSFCFSLVLSWPATIMKRCSDAGALRLLLYSTWSIASCVAANNIDPDVDVAWLTTMRGAILQAEYSGSLSWPVVCDTHHLGSSELRQLNVGNFVPLLSRGARGSKVNQSSDSIWFLRMRQVCDYKMKDNRDARVYAIAAVARSFRSWCAYRVYLCSFKKKCKTECLRMHTRILYIQIAL